MQEHHVRIRSEKRKRRKRRSPAASFAIATLALTCLVFLSLGFHWIKHGSVAESTQSLSAARSLVREPDEACRSVHRARDQCAFVKRHCPDEEAGLFSYLRLYYCQLPHAKGVAFAIIIIWTGLLFSTIGIASSDFFCINLSTISNLLGLSESLAGVTLLGFGNGSPDVFSTFAAVNSHSGSLAIGELIGAAGFITSVVAGSMALVRPFKVAKKSFIRDVSFFAVAVSFSMIFLANGSLELWECAVMVVFYVFYVIIVVVWHWWFGRKLKRKLAAEAAVKSQSAGINVQASSDIEPYRDEPQDQLSRIPSLEELNLGDVERANFEEVERLDEDIEEEERDKFLGELNSNMRITKRPDGGRRTVFNPIRPSLVGALEFRSVLSAIEKEERRSPSERRQSDVSGLHTSDQYFRRVNSDESRSKVLNNDIEHGRSTLEVRGAIAARGRAVSANDAAGLRIDPEVLASDSIPRLELLGASPPSRSNSRPQLRSAISQPDGLLSSDIFTSLGPTKKHLATSPSPSPRTRSRASTTHHLAPPSFAQSTRPPIHPHKTSFHQRHSSRSSEGQYYRPRAYSRKSASTDLRLHIPSFKHPSPKTSPPESPFTPYRDDPIEEVAEETEVFPQLAVSPGPLLAQAPSQEEEATRCRWWPYKWLPSPQVIGHTLFPTLSEWEDKNVWDKLLGILFAPSFFLLTITLPVVEPPKSAIEEESDAFNLDTPDVAEGASESTITAAPHTTTAAASELAEEHTTRHDWNRWLVILQCFTSPFFITLILWANTTESPASNPSTLLRPSLYSLAISLVLLTIVLLTSTPTRPPKTHYLLSLFGFLVSVTWISTLASEVVGILKTLGVLLNISDAILGLTIFAVGNSLGDLVADITVARLGFPVMALSACFGGPLLNILLGIGLSGIWIIVQGAEDRKHRHPERPVRFKPYRVEVSTTLMVSGAALLVTLVGLLVVVPCNGWRMDRRVGVGLIVLWVVATVGNVVVEVTGWGDDWAQGWMGRGV